PRPVVAGVPGGQRHPSRGGFACPGGGGGGAAGGGVFADLRRPRPCPAANASGAGHGDVVGPGQMASRGRADGVAPAWDNGAGGGGGEGGGGGGGGLRAGGGWVGGGGRAARMPAVLLDVRENRAPP